MIKYHLVLMKMYSSLDDTFALQIMTHCFSTTLIINIKIVLELILVILAWDYSAIETKFFGIIQPQQRF